ILIRLTKLTDTSLIVHWFTEKNGLIRTAAKGARRPKSPFAGKLDLFFSSEIHWSRSRHSDLHHLRESSPSHCRETIRLNYNSTLLASYFGRLLEASVEPEHPEPSLYDLLRRGLDHINESGASLRALHHFEHELTRLLGIAVHSTQAATALRDSLGKLPNPRSQLLDRL
ncbi:MAG: DNA repair protein RecO, partial [Verrucomicrobiales bacterium]